MGAVCEKGGRGAELTRSYWAPGTRKLKFFKLLKHLAYRAHLIYNSLTTLECVSPESREVSILYEQANCPVLLSLLGGLPICEWKKKQLLVIFFPFPLTVTVRERWFSFSINLLPHLLLPLRSPVHHPLPSSLYLPFSRSVPFNRSSFVGS